MVRHRAFFMRFVKLRWVDRSGSCTHKPASMMHKLMSALLLERPRLLHSCEIARCARSRPSRTWKNRTDGEPTLPHACPIGEAA